VSFEHRDFLMQQQQSRLLLLRSPFRLGQSLVRHVQLSYELRYARLEGANEAFAAVHLEVSSVESFLEGGVLDTSRSEGFGELARRGELGCLCRVEER
jgi:hypothetical protein